MSTATASVKALATFPTKSATDKLISSVKDVFDHMDNAEMLWHFRDLLAMATRSDIYRAMSATDAKFFCSAMVSLSDHLQYLSSAYDAVEAEMEKEKGQTLNGHSVTAN